MNPDRPYWRAALWLRRHRIRGKNWFVWHIGVLRIALPLAVLATLIRVASEPFRWSHLFLHIVANAVAALIGGWVAGRILWDLLVKR